MRLFSLSSLFRVLPSIVSVPTVSASKTCCFLFTCYSPPTSWRDSTRFCACIGTRNLSRRSGQVAQVANLLFRQLPVGGAPPTIRPSRNPKRRRRAALRYGRLATCATEVHGRRGTETGPTHIRALRNDISR